MFYKKNLVMNNEAAIASKTKDTKARIKSNQVKYFKFYK